MLRGGFCFSHQNVTKVLSGQLHDAFFAVSRQLRDELSVALGCQVVEALVATLGGRSSP